MRNFCLFYFISDNEKESIIVLKKPSVFYTKEKFPKTQNWIFLNLGRKTQMKTLSMETTWKTASAGSVIYDLRSPQQIMTH